MDELLEGVIHSQRGELEKRKAEFVDLQVGGKQLWRQGSAGGGQRARGALLLEIFGCKLVCTRPAQSFLVFARDFRAHQSQAGSADCHTRSFVRSSSVSTL